MKGKDKERACHHTACHKLVTERKERKHVLKFTVHYTYTRGQYSLPDLVTDTKVVTYSCMAGLLSESRNQFRLSGRSESIRI